MSLPKDPKKREQWLIKQRKPRPSMCGDKNPMKRPEIAKKSREAQRGIPHPTTAGENNPAKRPEVRAKISIAKTGKPRPDMFGAGNPCWVEDVVLICLECGKEFSLKPWVAKTKKICSSTCLGKYRSKILVGENNPNWHGGIGNLPYSFEFNEKFKNSIRERDNHVCQLCSKTKEQERQNLAVHHIYYDKENSDMTLKRYITLCNSCNNKVNSNRKNWIKFFESKLKGDNLC